MSENLQKLVGIAVMALIVVLGLVIPGQEQVNSFQRNSAVSSISSGHLGPSLPSSPSADKAGAVQAKIQSQVDKISDITAEIRVIMEELQALEPPQPPGEDATEDELKEYQELLQAFQQAVAELNKKLDSLQGELQKAKAGLNKLQNVDMPQAQREDAKALQEWAEKSQEAIEKQAEVTVVEREPTQRISELRKVEVDLLADCVTKEVGQVRLKSHIRNILMKCADAVTGMPEPPATG